MPTSKQFRIVNKWKREVIISFVSIYFLENASFSNLDYHIETLLETGSRAVMGVQRFAGRGPRLSATDNMVREYEVVMGNGTTFAHCALAG